jgi:hypothetical protein
VECRHAVAKAGCGMRMTYEAISLRRHYPNQVVGIVVQPFGFSTSQLNRD